MNPQLFRLRPQLQIIRNNNYLASFFEKLCVLYSLAKDSYLSLAFASLSIPVMTLNPISLKNVAAQWFRASEATGDFMGIRYGRKPAHSEVVEWTFVSHCDCDGIGGLARHLREDGAKLQTLPQTNYPNRKLIRPLWNRWRKRPFPGQIALREDWALSKQNETGPSKAVAWHRFSEEETEQIRRICRQEKISVNSLLLKQLDQTVRPDIKKPDAAIPWMIPVNLRGDIQHDDDTENHVSCIEPLVSANDSPGDIQRQIHDCLARGEHRLNYLLFSLGRFLSHTARVKVIEKTRSNPRGNIGAFSNLGAWDPEKVINTTDSWFFCPPVCKGQLLGAGCVTFQNRLSLTIQAHPSLSDQPEIANNWMVRWVDAL